jgi:hypothetical protein
MPVSENMRNAEHRAGSERGAALVIAIFSLMLISVVATSLILSAGTQTAIKANYKSATRAFYDAKAGLEEARGRLWANNPDSAAVLNCVFPGGQPMAPQQECYIINPASGETVDPFNQATTNPYADLEYKQEWGSPPVPGTPPIPSKSPKGAIAGPLFKWVRITATTEKSISPTFDSDADGVADITPLFVSGQNVVDSGKVGGTIPPGGAQLLTITSLAVTPLGSRRMVQYTVAPAALGAGFANFPSALTLDGNGVRFTGPSSSAGQPASTFKINGNDSSAPSGTTAGVAAIGYTNPNDASNVSSSAVPASNYLSPVGVLNVSSVTAPSIPSIPSVLQTPGGLDSLVQSITRGADLVLSPPSGTSADQTSLTAMSAANPMVVVVNGDFHLSHAGGSSFTGYGLLVVTGTLYYDPDASWNGIILVIGKGVFDGSQHGNGGQINGTVFVANTRDNSGNLLSNLGPASFKQTGGGNGIQYSRQLIASTEALMTYQVLSFREIQQTTP